MKHDTGITFTFALANHQFKYHLFGKSIQTDQLNLKNLNHDYYINHLRLLLLLYMHDIAFRVSTPPTMIR
jgi:hypothetical protein